MVTALLDRVRSLTMALPLMACVHQGAPAPQDVRLEAVTLVLPPANLPASQPTARYTGLALTVSTGSDLSMMARARNYELAGQAAYCSRWGADPGRQLRAYLLGAETQGGQYADGRWQFTVRVGVMQEPVVHGPARHVYDLRKDREDICVELAMVAWPILVATSNTVRIPAEAIRAALGPAAE